jgi:hypothetical protein
MDRKVIKQVRKALMLESIFSGASSLSKLFSETEDELDEVIRSIDEKAKASKLFEGKLFRHGKY